MIFQAKPEALDVDLNKSAVVVVDMQNAFASKNGMLDIAGADHFGRSRRCQSDWPGFVGRSPPWDARRLSANGI